MADVTYANSTMVLTVAYTGSLNFTNAQDTFSISVIHSNGTIQAVTSTVI